MVSDAEGPAGIPVTEAQITALIAAATAVRNNAWAPWSHFQVGAAVLAGSGRIYAGCNVENVSFSLTCCAERVAVFRAVAEGERRILACAVVTATDPPASPCGACRQVLHGFGPDAVVVLSNPEGRRVTTSMGELLPSSFDEAMLRAGMRG